MGNRDGDRRIGGRSDDRREHGGTENVEIGNGQARVITKQREQEQARAKQEGREGNDVVSRRDGRGPRTASSFLFVRSGVRGGTRGPQAPEVVGTGVCSPVAHRDQARVQSTQTIPE